MLPNLKGRPPVIPQGSIILVTGVNGFIGSHVADQLIQAGYIVRGTTRNIDKTAWLKDMFDANYGRGKFEAVVVEDMAEPRAFEEACKGLSPSKELSFLTDMPSPCRCRRGCTRCLKCNVRPRSQRCHTGCDCRSSGCRIRCLQNTIYQTLRLYIFIRSLVNAKTQCRAEHQHGRLGH